MSCAMYKINPLLELTGDDMAIKSPMYFMKNIQKDIISDCPEVSNGINDDPLSQIERNQDLLFEQISEIKKLLATMKETNPKIARKNTVFTKMSVNQPNLIGIGITYDVVLNANLKRPPFSLLAINKIWPEVLNVTYNCHIHSSVTSLPKNLNIFENLTNPSNTNAKQLRVRVVWKEMSSDCELIISPLNCVPLVGEVNFLRFLHSIVTPPLPDPYLQTMLDAKLDACYSLQFADSPAQLQQHLSTLSEGLDSYQWMFGDSPTVVDLAAWSTLKNMKKTSLSEPLAKWFQNCETFVKT